MLLTRYCDNARNCKYGQVPQWVSNLFHVTQEEQECISGRDAKNSNTAQFHGFLVVVVIATDVDNFSNSIN